MTSSDEAYQATVLLHDSEHSTPWHSPKRFIPLQPGVPQVWRLDLDPTLTPGRSLLAPEELARAERFRHEESRAHFIAGRSALRLLLGYELGIAPEKVELQTGPQGKPSLVPDNSVAFNVSHSGGVILIALLSDGDIGADVEQMTSDPNPLEIAERMFAPAEQAYLLDLAPAEQRTRFFRLWARKEAVIKADGRGLSLGTQTFDTTEETVTIPPIMYRLFDLPVGPTHAAALAVTKPDAKPLLLRFPPVSLPLV